MDNREFLGELVEAMYEELPAPKKKKSASSTNAVIPLDVNNKIVPIKVI